MARTGKWSDAVTWSRTANSVKATAGEPKTQSTRFVGRSVGDVQAAPWPVTSCPDTHPAADAGVRAEADPVTYAAPATEADPAAGADEEVMS